MSKIWKLLMKLLTPLIDKEMNEYILMALKPFNFTELYVKISAIIAFIFAGLSTFSADYLGISGKFAVMLLIMLFGDFITGVAAALRNGEILTSKKGKHTIYKTGAYIFFIYVAFMLNEELEGKATLFKEILKYFHLFLLIHISFWELFSVDENLKKLGLNLGITDLLKNTYNTVKSLFPTNKNKK